MSMRKVITDASGVHTSPQSWRNYLRVLESESFREEYRTLLRD